MKYNGKHAIADPLPINPWQAWRAVRLAGVSCLQEVMKRRSNVEELLQMNLKGNRKEVALPVMAMGHLGQVKTRARG